MSSHTSKMRAVVALWTLLKLGLCWAFDVHIHTSTDQVGKVVFNAGLGDEANSNSSSDSSRKWDYHMDPVRSSYPAQRYLAVDSLSGAVVLMSQPKCAFPQSAWSGSRQVVVIHARPRSSSVTGADDRQGRQQRAANGGPAEAVEVPLTVHLHGPLCHHHHHHHRRWSSSSGVGLGRRHLSLRRTRSEQVRVAVTLGEDQSFCVDKRSELLTLPDVVPPPPPGCYDKFRLTTSSPSGFSLDTTSGRLETTRVVCFLPHHHVLQGRLQRVCRDAVEAVPFKVVLSTQEEARYQSDGRSKMAANSADLHAALPRRRSRRSLGDRPTFPQRLYIKNIPEEQRPCCMVVGTFTIVDPEKHQVRYDLLATRDGRSQAMFTIDASSGQVSTTKPLDRESIPVHNFSITATSLANPLLSGQAALTVYVDDVNDHAPHFESTTYPQSVSESIGIGSTVLTVHASDEDTGVNAELEYILLNPSGPNSVFRINPVTGSIYTHGFLDREEHSEYVLNIQATDKAPVPDRKTATAEVRITILDENDNRPHFSQRVYPVTIRENRNYGDDPVVVISATDRDQGANGQVRYSITGGNNRNTFAIDAASGALTLLAPLDYEQTRHYELIVRAQDSGRPHTSNTTRVLVQVEDVNDNTPVFTTGHLQESLLENEPVGHTITRIQAFDADDGANAALIYSIVEAPANLPFSIDRQTGVLTTNRELDREKNARYFFQIEAVDQGDPPRSSTASVQITVRDVNDNAPIFEPKLYEEIVSEEAPPGTMVLSVTAVDHDENENGRVSYAITDGNDGNAFSIIRQTGQGLISVARTLNYKEQSRYILSVTASDPGGLVDTALVYINVSDANTHRPVFTGTPYQTRVDENTAVGTTIFKVVAFDHDVGENARITYSMDDNEAFQINPVTGDILIKHPLDREKLGAYTVSVTARDNGRPSRSDTADVEITVLDVNDNSPVFLKDYYSGRVAEDAFVGSSILTISARDADSGLNGRVWYTFDGGNDGGGDFKLDPTFGILRIAKPLDRERIDHYELRAFAVDGGGTSGSMERSTSVVINIEVEDVNDNAPWFEAPQLSFDIAENSAIGTEVSSVSAVDPDAGVNAEVDYSIVGGADASSFALHTRPREPAVLTTLTELDYESGKKRYILQVRARSAHLFSDVIIFINVIDINDNVPLLKDFVIIFNNFRNHFPTGEIGRVPASDPDVNDVLRYRFISGNAANVLHLDEKTGMIRLDSRLNSDVPTNGTLQVSVSDGVNKVKATCRLFVRLVTEGMLHNSITVRLNALSQEAFLSPLYYHFVTALASVIPTTADNVYVINVNDDTDVAERILNVSFSVRRAVVDNKDVFYSPQFLKERVYHQRRLLAKLSTLQVLPFDDNLCVREPCLNFEQCLSILKFGNASAFIGSDTMLFRPIHPINAFACQCPKGFTGMDAEYLCDTEVNLCFSSPCGGNGTCQQRESGFTCTCNEGFTGDQCEIDMRQQKYSKCPPGVCKSNSQCAPLIRGGFRCERCPSAVDDADGSSAGADDDGAAGQLTPTPGETFCIDCADLEHHTAFCELTTRSFLPGSFLMFPSLKRRHRFLISLEFATREQNGLLFYNGRYNERHDFIALQLIDGRVQFSFSLGGNISRVEASLEGGNDVNDGNWHSVSVYYFNRTVTLTVGEMCDTQVAVRLRETTGNMTCAAKTKHVLEERCRDMTETCYRFLDLTGPFQVGGLPNLHAEFQVSNTDFVGCVRQLRVDQRFVDLNDYVWESGTVAGCPQKRPSCPSDPCRNGGTCHEAWHTYTCRCPAGWGGKDCSQAIEPPRRLTGTSYLRYASTKLPAVHLPWYNGVSFRTRQPTSLLMHIDLGKPNFVNIEIVKGLVHYIHTKKTVVLDSVRVDDGRWHYLETRWLSGQLIVTLDYGQIKLTRAVGNLVAGKSIHGILVGGQVNSASGTDVVLNGFKGCIENVRVGNSANSILTDPLEHNVEPGCRYHDPCDFKPCPNNSYCYNQWQHYTCGCVKGYDGSDCQNICEALNPCQNGATCKSSELALHGYTCSCAPGFTGTYCQTSTSMVCPAAWWGSPICGPCNCPKDRGFNPSCNKTTGLCSCKENHFQPAGSDTCYPCDCYSIGSYRRACDRLTGQCPCRSGVIGRRCDSCSSRFAEVTLRGCEVVYDSCPRSFDQGLWWDRTLFDEAAVQSCPEGTVGDAYRKCTAEGWQKPNIFNCTSDKFVDLYHQMVQFNSGALKVNTFVAKHLMAKLALATNETEKLYGMDLRITYNLITQILQHEVKQSGLNLTHTQDRRFVQNLVNTVGRILDPENAAVWREVHEVEAGLPHLLEHMERYGATMAKNMLSLFTQPFDAVHKNLVFGLDLVVKDNRSAVAVPKFNNKVQSAAMFDKESRIYVPLNALSQPSMADMVTELVENRKPQAVVSYILYRTLGDMLPFNLAKDVQSDDGVPLQVTSPVVSVSLVDGNRSVGGRLSAPIVLELLVGDVSNRSRPQCVYWRTAGRGGRGEWSTDGCRVVRQQRHTAAGVNSGGGGGGGTLARCECNHLSTFGVIMDVSSIEYLRATMFWLHPITYVGVALGILFLAVALLIFCFLRGLYSNTNSIHINLVLSILLSNLIFIVGIDKVDAKMGCKVVAILLHYFFMASFSWLFVATLHLYRMLTEIRNIDQGSMKFYYVLGYVLPGIVVGLAVGLNTDAYGGRSFCWLRTDEPTVWSLAGPVCAATAATLTTLVLGLVASCRGKQADPQLALLRHGLRAAVVLLPLVALVWAFALLAVNDRVLPFQYLFAAFCLLEGIFIFLAYVVFSKRVRREIKYAIWRLQGKKTLDDTMGDGHTSPLSRSALAYHNDSSLDGGLNRMNVGISTTSTTSRSTSKSSGGLYRTDGYLGHSLSTSNSATGPTGYHGHHPPNVGIAPYGYDSSAFHNKGIDDPDTGELASKQRRRHHRRQPRRDSDSDSELSAIDQNDLDLASSHSSDEDEDEDVNDPFQWDRFAKTKPMPRGPAVLPAKPGAQPPASTPPHNTLTAPPPPYSSLVGKPQWPGEGNMSTTTVSDTEVKAPHDQIKVSVRRPPLMAQQQQHSDRQLPPIPGSPRIPATTNGGGRMAPPERVDSLPADQPSPRERIAVQVLTHNGSITSESETTSDSDSSDAEERWA